MKDVGSDLPSTDKLDFNTAAGDYEASLKASADTLLTWSQTLENSIQSITKFSLALDTASKKAGAVGGRATVPGMAAPAEGATPGMAPMNLSGGIGTVIQALMAKGISQAGPVPGMASNASANSMGGAGANAASWSRGGAAGSAITRGSTALFDAGASMGEGSAVGGGMMRAGLAGAEMAPVAGQIIMVMKGMWDTLKFIGETQKKVHEGEKAAFDAAKTGGAGVDKSTTGLQQMAYAMDKADRTNTFLKKDVSKAAMATLFGSQQMGGKDVREMLFGADQGMMSSKSSGSRMMNMMATGFDINKDIAPNLARSAGMFGGAPGSDSSKAAIKDMADEFTEMKIRSQALGVNQSLYMKTQWDLIGEDRIYIESIKDTRAATDAFAKSIENGIVSVQTLNSTLMGAGHSSLQQDMQNLVMAGPAMNKIFKKFGMTEASEQLGKAQSGFDVDAMARMKELIAQEQKKNPAFAGEFYRATQLDPYSKLMNAKTGAGEDYTRTFSPGLQGSLDFAQAQGLRRTIDAGGSTEAGRLPGIAGIEEAKSAQASASTDIMSKLGEIWNGPVDKFDAAVSRFGDFFTSSGSGPTPYAVALKPVSIVATPPKGR